MLLPAMQISNSSRPLIRIAHRLMRCGGQSDTVIYRNARNVRIKMPFARSNTFPQRRPRLEPLVMVNRVTKTRAHRTGMLALVTTSPRQGLLS